MNINESPCTSDVNSPELFQPSSNGSQCYALIVLVYLAIRSKSVFQPAITWNDVTYDLTIPLKCHDLISKALTLIFNRSVNTGIFPDKWNMLKSLPFINMVNVIVQTIIEHFPVHNSCGFRKNNLQSTVSVLFWNQFVKQLSVRISWTTFYCHFPS